MISAWILLVVSLLGTGRAVQEKDRFAATFLTVMSIIAGLEIGGII